MQLKKIFAIFLAATLIFSVFAISVSAENVETLKVGVVAETATPISDIPQIFNQGDEVSYKISVDQNPGISMLWMRVYYNANAYEYVSYTSSGLFSQAETFTLPEDGVIQYKLDYTKFSTDAIGEAFTLTLKVKEGFCGDTDVYAELKNNSAANCLLITSSQYDMAFVPFEGGSTTVNIHDIVAEDGVVTDPTCLDEGFTTYKCNSCEEEVVGNIVSATGHFEAEAVVENRVEPTCLEKGAYDSVVYCAVCDAELSREEQVIDALGHDLSTTEAKDPSCTEIGWGAYDTCSRCDYTTYEEIPANGHTEADVVIENNIKPTCTANGSYDNVVYCSVCDAELLRETVTVDALGHTLDIVEAKEPTCTEIGWDAYEKCLVCDYTTYVVKDAIGHNAADVVEENRIEATCTQNGSYDSVVYCSVCDAELSREKNVINALGHDLSTTDAKEPTCTEIGWGAYDTCSRCDYTTYEEISAMGHTLVTVEAKEPTCTEKGWDAYEKCSECDYTACVVKDAIGHNAADAVEENRVEATCTENGSYDTVVYCSVCNSELSREGNVIDASGHDLSTTEAKEPTCTEIGWDAYEACSKCDYTTYVEKVALGHKDADAVEENRVEPTCEENGSYDSVVYCTVCNAEISRETVVIDALGHRNQIIISQDPTCTEPGWTEYIECARCGEQSFHFDIAPLGHSYGETTVIKPQYQVDGYSTHTCNVCNYEEIFDVTPALTYITGDVNGDEVVNNKDLGLLMQYLNDWKVEINSDAADVNGDGVVNNKDYGLLMQYLNDWAVELG